MKFSNICSEEQSTILLENPKNNKKTLNSLYIKLRHTCQKLILHRISKI
jgi:hypothetical protein